MRFDALSAQTAFEVAQSLFADPISLVFAQHAELFGCPSTAEHAARGLEHVALRDENTALQQELAAARARIAELESRPVPVPPPASAPGGTNLSLDVIQNVLVTLTPVEAREFAQVLIHCCWKARIPIPEWLTAFAA